MDKALLLCIGILVGALVRSYFGGGLESAKAWWVINDPYRSRTVYMEDVDAKTLELRRRVMPELAKVTPGYSTCGSCGAPWSFVSGHSTDYAPGRGMFPLCEWCFKTLRSLGRDEEIVGHYLALHAEWADTDVPPRAQVEEAIRAELRGESHMVGLAGR